MTDVRRGWIQLLWSSVRVKALTKDVFDLTWGIPSIRVCKRMKLPGMGVHSEKVRPATNKELTEKVAHDSKS